MAIERMMVTGYRLREAIKSWELRRNTAVKQFEQARWVFEGEENPSLEELASAARQAESAIAILQTAQASYNLSITITVADEPMTLCQAVKLVGGAGRIEKLWRSAAAGEDSRYAYGVNRMVRQRDQEMAKPAVTPLEAISKTDAAAKYANALRSAVALGNAEERELELPAELLE